MQKIYGASQLENVPTAGYIN